MEKLTQTNNTQNEQNMSIRLRPQPSQRPRKLLKKLESKFSAGPFYDYSHYDSQGDDEMIKDYGHGPEGIQVECQEIANFVNTNDEFEISDMELGDFVIAEDDYFFESDKSAHDLNITNAKMANLPSGEYAEFGFVELDAGENIPVLYVNYHGYTIYSFIPTMS